MIHFLKVIDIVVELKNLDKAAYTWANIFGVEPILMREDYNPDGGIRAYHVPLPAGEMACHAIGIMAPIDDVHPGGRHLREHLQQYGEGVYLIGFMVDDPDRVQEALEENSKLDFRWKKPIRYAAGIHNITKIDKRTQGICIEFARHDDGALERWRQGG